MCSSQHDVLNERSAQLSLKYCLPMKTRGRHLRRCSCRLNGFESIYRLMQISTWKRSDSTLFKNICGQNGALVISTGEHQHKTNVPLDIGRSRVPLTYAHHSPRPQYPARKQERPPAPAAAAIVTATSNDGRSCSIPARPNSRCTL